MIRLKIKSIASDKGYTLGQYIFLAIFHAVSDWDEEAYDPMYKFNSLFRLNEIGKRKKSLMELENVIDYGTFTRLRRIKNKYKIKKINELDEEERVLALKKYFANTNAYGMQTGMIADWLGNM